MENECSNIDLVSYYNNMFDKVISDSILREINSFQGSSNPYCEIELPKEIRKTKI